MSISPILSTSQSAIVAPGATQVALTDHFKQIIIKQHGHENNITQAFFNMLVKYDAAHADARSTLRDSARGLQGSVQKILDKLIDHMDQPDFNTVHENAQKMHTLSVETSFAASTQFLQHAVRLSELTQNEDKGIISEALATKMKLMAEDLNLQGGIIQHVQTLKQMELDEQKFANEQRRVDTQANEDNLRYQEGLHYKAWYEEMSIALAMASGKKQDDSGFSLPVFSDIKNAAVALAKTLTSTNRSFNCTPPRREGDRIIPGTVSLESTESCVIQ